MAVMFDSSIVSHVQQASDIVDVISEHVSLAKKGKEMVGVCPFHNDHRPSMYVSGAKQIFKCFACGAGGSVITFVQMRENLTFPQAIERLAERAGIKLERRQKSKSKTQEPDTDPNELAKVNAWAAKYFQRNLYHDKRGKLARDYIAERQIAPESSRKWQLGLALDSRDDLLRAAKTKGISENLLTQAGLVVTNTDGKSYADKFTSRLMFPITDVTGRIIGFGGRTLDGAPAKYINSPTTALFDKSNSVYGLQHARHQIVSTGIAVVAEGYTDCIMAHQFGCDNVVATLGTSFTAGHARILRRYAKKIVLVFDSDAAGAEAANRALEICLAQRIDIALASVPEGKDPCDFLLTAGKDRFEQLLENAVDVLKAKWKRLAASFDRNGTIAENKAAVEEFLQAIATGLWTGNVPTVEVGLFVNRLSGIIGLSSKQINTELNRRIKRIGKTAGYGAGEEKVQSVDFGEGFFASAQREILEVLLNEPKLFEVVRQEVRAELFDVPILRQIATILFEALDVGTDNLLRAVLAKAESPKAGMAITELAQAGEQKGNFESRLAGALDATRRYQRQQRKNQIRTAKDQTQFLERFSENTVKQNPYNVGMV